MPAAAKFTYDDYWAMSENELARNAFEYCGWLLCGGRKPNSAVPNVQNSNQYAYTFDPGNMVYDNIHYQRIYDQARLQHAAYQEEAARIFEYYTTPWYTTTTGTNTWSSLNEAYTYYLPRIPSAIAVAQTQYQNMAQEAYTNEAQSMYYRERVNHERNERLRQQAAALSDTYTAWI